MLEQLKLNVSILCAIIQISIKDYNDLDTSSESEYESDQGSTPRSNSEKDELSENLEPELSELIHNEYDNALSNPRPQLEAQRLA